MLREECERGETWSVLSNGVKECKNLHKAQSWVEISQVNPETYLLKH